MPPAHIYPAAVEDASDLASYFMQHVNRNFRYFKMIRFQLKFEQVSHASRPYLPGRGRRCFRFGVLLYATCGRVWGAPGARGINGYGI